MSRTAVIAGSSGLVGGCLLERLLHEPEYTKVTSLVRRPSLVKHAKTDERVVGFESLADLEFDRGADVFCALGTTIKKAGSQEAFRVVDRDYPTALARRSKELGAERILVVSSVGASASSSNFYLKVKGEMQDAIAAMELPSVHFFQPSFLMGFRSEIRAGEALGTSVAHRLRFLMLGGLRKYRPVSADLVAAAMIAAALRSSPGVQIHTHQEIVELAHATAARRAASY